MKRNLIQLVVMVVAGVFVVGSSSGRRSTRSGRSSQRYATRSGSSFRINVLSRKCKSGYLKDCVLQLRLGDKDYLRATSFLKKECERGDVKSCTVLRKLYYYKRRNYNWLDKRREARREMQRKEKRRREERYRRRRDIRNMRYASYCVDKYVAQARRVKSFYWIDKSDEGIQRCLKTHSHVQGIAEMVSEARAKVAAHKKALCSGSMAKIYKMYDKLRLTSGRTLRFALWLRSTGLRNSLPKQTRVFCLYELARCVNFSRQRAKWNPACVKEANSCHVRRKHNIKALYIEWCTGRKVKRRGMSKKQRKARLCRRGMVAVFKVYGRNLVRNSVALAYWSLKGLKAAAYLPGLTQKWCVPYFAKCMGNCGVVRLNWRGWCLKRGQKCLRNARICHRKFKRIMRKTYRKHCGKRR